MAEQIERSGWTAGLRQPDRLARFLAERGRNSTEAGTLAEEAATSRRDIMTLDTLAWSYFKAGRLTDARRASDEALRLGTRDARLLYHAAEIVAASGDRTAAKVVLDRRWRRNALFRTTQQSATSDRLALRFCRVPATICAGK